MSDVFVGILSLFLTNLLRGELEASCLRCFTHVLWHIYFSSLSYLHCTAKRNGILLNRGSK